MTKLTENAFREVNIAFANELSLICDELNINVWELIRMANRHPRVNILQPGPGVGGHCIPIDPWFIVHQSPETARLIRTARQVNDSKIDYVIAQVKAMATRFEQPVISCMVLTFKPDVDDLRESPALGIVETLAQEKVGRLLIVEPNIRQLPPTLEALELCSLEVGLRQADIVVFLVRHRQFIDIRPPFCLKEKLF